jgi:nucleoside-diphosphate-sugar epimerase
MTILLTGAGGFVGMNLLELLLGRGHSVVAFTNADLPAGAARLPGYEACTVIRGDMRDRDSVDRCFQNRRIERVLHAAAVTSDANRERTHGDDIISANLAGTATVVASAARHGAARFVMVGSGAVHGSIEEPGGGAAALPRLITEDAPHNPVTLYDISKSAAEGIVGRIAALNGMGWAVGRLGTVFGPWERQTGFRDTLSPIHQVNAIARAGGHATLPAPTRTNWHYSRDAAEALVTLLMAERSQHALYNLEPPLFWSLSDWCARLKHRFPEFSYTIGGTTETAVNVYDVEAYPQLSSERFEAEFGPVSRYGLDEAFEDYLARGSCDSET